jgi:hypothetical protein
MILHQAVPLITSFFNSRFEALRRRKEQQELEAVEAIQNMERAHMKAAEELESLYEKKLAIEAQRCEI